jgi:hypothetical protein
VNTFPKKSLSHRSMEEQFASLQQASVIKKVFHLEVDKNVIINLKWNMCKAKI